MKQNLTRNEESVSAAIATVLLFGGVVSIIGLMLVSMLPIIEELEGSIERDDMSSQMMILSQQTEILSEHGMPGDSTEIDLIPIDGTLSWDTTRGGMWYSSTWNSDTTFRMKGVLNFDDTIQIKHPESKTTSVCFDDLRLGPTKPFIYSIPNYIEEIMISPNQGIASPLGPVELKVYSDNQFVEKIELNIASTVKLTTTELQSYKIESSHELNVLASFGSGGSTMFMPDNPSQSDFSGRSWSIPMDEGSNTLHIMSKTSNKVELIIDSQSTSHLVTSGQDQRIGVSWTHTINLDSPQLVSISTSAPSRLIMLSTNDNLTGSLTLQSTSGAFIGSEFNTPELPGSLELFNPNDELASVTWKGGGISILSDSTVVIPWPPQGISGTPIIDSDKEIAAYWHNNDSSSQSNGINIIPAKDTGFSSGKSHRYDTFSSSGLESIHTQLAGYETRLNYSSSNSVSHNLTFSDPFDNLQISQGSHNITVEEGHPVRVHRSTGDSGLVQLMHDGQQRCVGINTTGSGWITTDVAWKSVAGRSDSRIMEAWIEGAHPSSYSVNLIGNNGNTDHQIIASSWIFHISRLTYSFSSSITGLEVAYSNGAVVTNHPEFLPTVLKQPNDRSGPGPRFAATIPALNPTADSSSGAGIMNLDIELAYRESLASDTAYEVRRGWYSPYGEEIANSAASGLDSSLDWTIYPGRLDLLSDYVGWVPDPSIGTSEAVWHTNGEPIQFSLQLSSLDVTMTEAVG